jgi:sterol desaturase/sphingolipid hydroxylase (fatty acid hydroxylase superfamily)
LPRFTQEYIRGGFWEMIEYLFEAAKADIVSIAKALAVPMPFFVVLGLIAKGRGLARDVIRASRQGWLNFLMLVTDTVLIAPILVALVALLSWVFRDNGLSLISPSAWSSLPPFVVVFLAVFLGDFIGYWRHRLEHWPVFWPSHAIHHSDDEMTWLAIFRFHPINRFTTVLLDFSFLLAWGLPEYAVLANLLVRNYYGAFIHADLPWSYGPLRYVFVSPAMHRWHHAADVEAYNTNFATVFSLFDIAFGTFRVPGPCDVPLGVPDKIGDGLVNHLVYPLRPRAYRRIWRVAVRGREAKNL